MLLLRAEWQTDGLYAASGILRQTSLKIVPRKTDRFVSVRLCWLRVSWPCLLVPAQHLTYTSTPCVHRTCPSRFCPHGSHSFLFNMQISELCLVWCCWGWTGILNLYVFKVLEFKKKKEKKEKERKIYPSGFLLLWFLAVLAHIGDW